jgi:methanogenic corrinoid protein MtbC1
MVTDEKIIESFLNLSEPTVMDEVRTRMETGVSSEDIIRSLQDGITAVGDAFGEGRMFVPDLMISASIFEKAIGLVMPDDYADRMRGQKGKIVIGTVKDDFHNIGKDLASKMLKCAGYKIIDVGVDVEPADFVGALKDSGAKALALSCLLTSSYAHIIKTIEAVKEAGIRSRVKIIVGGAPIDEKSAIYCGADAYGPTARSAVTFAEEVYS